MPTLYLFRHGETDWNRDRRFQGHTDIELNEVGRAQARELTKRLRTLNLQVLLTSDLKRAQETAEIVNASLKLPFFVSQDLRECKLGDPEGMYRDKIVEVYGAKAWDRWLSVNPEDHDYGFPNGETKKIHHERLAQYLENFCDLHPEYQHIGVSTHGGSVRRLVHACLGAPVEAIPLPNCALYEIQYEPKPKQWKYIGGIQEKPDSADADVWGKTKT